MIHRVSYQPAIPWIMVTDVDIVDDHVFYELDSDLRAIANLDQGSSAINCLIVCHDEFLVQPDFHVVGECDPEGLHLDNGVAQRARLWVHHVVVRWVRHLIESPVLASCSLVAKSESAIGQLLPVAGPIWITPPAAVNRVGGHASVVLIVAQFPSGAVVASCIPAMEAFITPWQQRANNPVKCLHSLRKSSHTHVRGGLGRW
ncbi:hypothetical protein MLD38_039470 [Melastoma candidum]|uniref:Uncharacterized protein n=1 Tax=Melastoma candidum TaxID=119954 RepID=A0ACB9L388_9MYRT|nr:hypothetical protein MLD38_039470 [Melastoma candidum]